MSIKKRAMNILIKSVLFVILITLVSCQSKLEKVEKEDMAELPYDGSWEALQKMPVPGLVERLKAMGEWLKLNGDAIYSTRYWKEYWQEKGHLAFTTKVEKLYAIALEKPEAPFVIKGTKELKENQIKSVRLLGANEEVKWEMTSEGLNIIPPSNLGLSKYAWSFEIITDTELHTPNAIENNVDKAFKGTKKVDLEGANQ